MNKYAAQFLMMIAGTLRGAVGGALSYLNTLLKSGFNTATQFHQEGIAFAREMGMNAKEAQAYTEVLTDRTEKLAAKYGVAAEQVKELQRNISIATSRQLMLNETQAEQFLQLNKLVGSSTVSKFTEEMMNGMGGQVDAVTGAVSKAYATAAKSGLNAQKVSEKIASNLGMANRLSFRNGVEGLTRMAMQAEKMGMNLSSVETAAGKFLDLQDAIQNTAKLQMLGGSAGAMFSNPLTAAYEANYDPEAFAKRMQDSLASYATFDANKGVSSVNGMNMDFVRNIAQAMGISTEEATRMAKKNAEVKYKESHINTSAYRGMGLSQEQIDFLINKSTVKDGKVMFTDMNNNTTELSANGKINEKVLEEMMKYNGMSDRDIMEENARSLTSINEKLKGIGASISAMFAKFLEGLFPNAVKDLEDIGEFAKNHLEPIAKNVGEAARGVYDWFKNNQEMLKSVASGILGFIKAFTGILAPIIKFASDWPKSSLAIIGAIWGARQMNKMFPSGGKGASGAANGSNGMSWKQAKNAAKASQRTSLRNGASRWGAASKAAKNLTKNVKWLGRGVKGVAGIGTALAALEIGSSIYDAEAKKNEIEKNQALSKAKKQEEKDKVTREEHKNVGEAGGALAGGLGGAKVGAIVGSMIAPGIGTVIGGLLGGIAGGIGGAFVGKGIGSATSSLATSHANGGFITGGTVGAETPISKYGDTAQKGEVILNPTQQKNFMALANNETTVKAKPVGEKEYIYTPNRSETSNVNGNTITVKDFNINLSGTIKLDGGNSSKNIDVNALLNDYQFMSSLKEMIKTSINNDMNGGRYMNDLATRRGQVSSSSIIAK